MSFCTQCGSERQLSHKFCGSCGAAFEGQTVTGVPTSGDQSSQSPVLAGVASQPGAEDGGPKRGVSEDEPKNRDAPRAVKAKERSFRKWPFAVAGVGVVAILVATAIVQDSSGYPFLENRSKQAVQTLENRSKQANQTLENSRKQTEARDREPYGGQCVLVGPAALDATLATVGLGYANFDIDSQAARDFVVRKGYQSFDEWVADVENLYGFVSLLDQTQLSADEARVVETLTSSLRPGEMARALIRGDSAWFEDMNSSMISLGADCDGEW